MHQTYKDLDHAGKYLASLVPYRDALFGIWGRIANRKKVEVRELDIDIPDFTKFSPPEETFLAAQVKRIHTTLGVEKILLASFVSQPQSLAKATLGEHIETYQRFFSENEEYVSDGVLLPLIKAHHAKIKS